MNDEAVLVFATLRPQAGKEAELLELLREMIDHTRREAGNEVYDLYSSSGEQAAFHLFERYSNEQALQAHRDADYYKAYRAKVPELLASPVEVVVLKAVDTTTL